MIITHLGHRLSVNNAGDFHLNTDIGMDPGLVSPNFRLICGRESYNNGDRKKLEAMYNKYRGNII